MKYSKTILESYAQPISNTEKEQCEHAIDMVKDALVEYGYKISNTRKNYSSEGYAFYYELRESDYSSTVTVLVQGSYANNTNIKRYSDVDVSVISKPIIPISLEKSFNSFKTKIYNALCRKFGSDVVRKNKSINVKGNTYRKSIDVVPAYSVGSNIEDGIQFLTDKGEKIVNYPLKQIKNENSKNSKTKYMFKKYVRILKNIKEDMEESYIQSAKEVGSFQVESLLWNLDDSVFTKYITLGYGVEEILDSLKTKKYLLDYYYESNGIKKLCPNSSMKILLQDFIDDLIEYFKYEG